MMQKRAILFFFIYLFSLSGLMVNFHFCADELSSWKIALQANNTEDIDCCCEELNVSSSMMMDCMDDGEENDCCNDQEVMVKTANDYLQFSSSSILGFDFFSQAILPIFPLEELLLKNQVILNVRINDPPLFKVKSTAKYIQYKRLLFYA